MTALLALLLQSGGAAQTPPPFGLTVAPKSAEVRALERSDPVARRCAELGDGLAAKVRAEIGAVTVGKAPDGGTVWSATLLMEREPPLAPRITCDSRTFTIANDTFDVSTPPEKMAWPYCGWGLSKEERLGVKCDR